MKRTVIVLNIGIVINSNMGFYVYEIFVNFFDRLRQKC